MKIEKDFEDLVHGRNNFWDQAVEINADELRALVILGLRETSGSYRRVAELFHIDMNDYQRFMGLLRKSNSHIDSSPLRRFARAQI